MAALFLGAFIWSVKSGQYEDDYTPSIRILFDNIDKANLTNKTKTDDSRKV
jgi:cbb3-type cytochrome oxidase maturation protein